MPLIYILLRWLSIFLKTGYYFSFTWIDVESLMTFPLYETVSYHKVGIRCFRLQPQKF